MEEPKEDNNNQEEHIEVTSQPPVVEETHQPTVYHYDKISDSSPKYTSWKVVSGGLVTLIALIAVISVIAFHNSNGPSSSGNSTLFALTGPSSLPPALVTVSRTGFSPSTVNITVGQAVSWTNNDSASHSVTNNTNEPLDASAPNPNSNGSIAPGDNYSYVFNKAGTYEYHDSAADPSFHGTVIVSN